MGKLLNWYEQWVSAPIDEIDSGQLHRKILLFVLRLASVGIAVSVLVQFATQLDVYLATLEQQQGLMPVVSSQVATGLVLLLSLVTGAFMAGVLWKRTNQIAESEETALLPLVFRATIPRLLHVAFEWLAAMALLFGLCYLVAFLVAGNPLIPTAGWGRAASGLISLLSFGLISLPDSSANGLIIHAEGHYFRYLFSYGFGGLLWGLAGAAWLLFVGFFVVQVYTYLLKLVEGILDFLPRFALPLSLRRLVIIHRHR